MDRFSGCHSRCVTSPPSKWQQDALEKGQTCCACIMPLESTMSLGKIWCDISQLLFCICCDKLSYNVLTIQEHIYFEKKICRINNLIWNIHGEKNLWGIESKVFRLVSPSIHCCTDIKATLLTTTFVSLHYTLIKGEISCVWNESDENCMERGVLIKAILWTKIGIRKRAGFAVCPDLRCSIWELLVLSVPEMAL